MRLGSEFRDAPTRMRSSAQEALRGPDLGTADEPSTTPPLTRAGVRRDSMRRAMRELRSTSRSLYLRVLLINAAILVAATLVLAFTPVTVSSPLRSGQADVLVIGVVVSVIANGVLLRVALAPLDRLKAAMRNADVLQPGRRLPAEPGISELNELAVTFNDMLGRLEDERRSSAVRASEAEEALRRGLARDLHDDIGQRLTAVLLYLKRSAATTTEPSRSGILEAQTAIRDALDEVRRVLRQIRPEVLEELGLPMALAELADGFAAQTGLEVDQALNDDLPRLVPSCELALYRIAQEALTNVARHADARRARIELARDENDVVLSVMDDGRGMAGSTEGGGIRGMRERAIPLCGTLTIMPRPGGGSTVRLRVPLTAVADP
jgi:two-component system, NarL family, sensor histidine kinase UhpB